MLFGAYQASSFNGFIWRQVAPTPDPVVPWNTFSLESSTRLFSSPTFWPDCVSDLQTQINARGSVYVVFMTLVPVGTTGAKLVALTYGLNLSQVSATISGNYFS